MKCPIWIESSLCMFELNLDIFLIHLKPGPRAARTHWLARSFILSVLLSLIGGAHLVGRPTYQLPLSLPLPIPCAIQHRRPWAAAHARLLCH
jgi:hypothetical protein